MHFLRFPLVERGSVYFEFPGPEPVETGIWSFKLKLAPAPTKSTVDLSVAAYAVADGPTVTVSTWTTADGRLSRPSDGPVILYARVMDGSFPVAGASVLAEVRGPQGGLVSVDLVDDGSGYPDVTSGDGIYRCLKLYFR